MRPEQGSSTLTRRLVGHHSTLNTPWERQLVAYHSDWKNGGSVNAREETWQRKLPVSSNCRSPPAGESGAPGGHGARPAGNQHHGVLQGVQRSDAGAGCTILPVEVTIFSDKSFTFITKTPPAAVLLKKEAGVEKGSGTPNKQQGRKVTRAQVRKIAELKMPDLNCDTVEAAEAMVAGAARSMGIEVTG